ncbi:MAG: hypothetical protein HYZ53_20905 [Planctomycetes bacterium]|nr:hypothetical protein [Planctomycetota bacterium]
MNIAAAVTGTILTTTQLCARLGTSRNVLTRLRAQYPARLPEPIRLGNALGWPVEAVEVFGALLREEDRIREGCRR